MNDFENLKAKLQLIAEQQGFEFTDKADKIINAKLRLGLSVFCPCHPEDKKHSCISELCRQSIRTKGTCCCGLYRPKQN